MRFISWNVNGLRACMQKGFLDVFQRMNADFFCLQETKLQAGQIALDLPGYEQYWCYAEKKGYSGTAIFTKHTPMSVVYGLGVPELDTEGRLITLEYPEFYLVTCYTPNAQRELARLEHRMHWEAAFRSYLTELDSRKPVVICGDLNVAHQNIDLKNPASNRGSAGFSDEERGCFTQLLESGFTDTFRYLNPTATGAYTWWSYMFKARQNNAGWRIDYFLVSDRLREQIYAAPIYPDVMGSDHCPVGLDLQISCNGGIWWSSEDISTTVLETAEKEEPAPKKSSGTKAAASLLSMLFFFLIGMFAWRALDLTPETFPSATEVPATTHSTAPPVPDWEVETQAATADLDWDPVEIIRYSTEPIVYFTSPVSSSFSTISDGIKIWRLATLMPEETFPPCGINYWVRIVPQYSELMDHGELHASLHHFENAGNHSGYSTSVYTTRYYDEYGHIAGWIIYGYIPRDMFLNITVKDTVLGIYKTEQIIVSPTLSYQDAAAMTTLELTDYAVHSEVFHSIYDPGDPALCMNFYTTLARSFPGFGELVIREDFLKCANAFGRTDSTCSVNAPFLQKVARYLQDNYSFYGIFPSPAQASTMTTEEILTYLQNHWGFQHFLSLKLGDYGDPLTVYQSAQHFNPLLWEMERRDDAGELLLQHMGENKTADFLIVQQVFLQKLTLPQLQLFMDKIMGGQDTSTMPTEELAYFMSNAFHVYSSITVGYPYNYGQLLQYFPPMQDLENRADSIDVMLHYLSSKADTITWDQRLFFSNLLKLDVYQNSMNEEQKQLYEQYRVYVK